MPPDDWGSGDPFTDPDWSRALAGTYIAAL